MTNREKISGVDTAWLRMEQPTNLMMIVGVMMFERRVRLADVKRLIERRWLGFPRFRQKAASDASGSWWQDDEAFDMGWHVQRVRLPGAAGKRELEALVSDLASTPLDFGRPLWQFHLVDNYRGGSALVTRVHHCYADGIALVQVMLSMTHPDAAASVKLPRERPAPRAGTQAQGDLWSQVMTPVSGALETATRLGRDWIAQGYGLAANPRAAVTLVREAAGKSVDFTAELTRLLTMGSDSPTRFKGALGTRKQVAWAEPLPLDEVKAVGKAFGCSINDVLLSMASGALRDYLIEKGDAVDALEIRAVVPVNLRPQGAGRDLGNHFGLVFLGLPIGMSHPLERLYEVRRRMLALKGSYQPLISLGLLSAVGYGPRVLQDQVTTLLGANASAVMTNVPGPQHPLYFAGQRIVELDFWVPQSGGIGMGVSILSYDGRIQFGVITDAGLVPDPDAIVGRFAEEFAKLMWITLMSPWGERSLETGRPRKAAGRRKKPAAAPETEPGEAPRIPRRFRNL